MLRSILGALVGYVVMVALVMAGIAVVWFGFGNAFAFKEGTFEASTGWSLLGMLTGFIAAVGGGFVAALVAPGGNFRVIKILVGIILALGLLLAIGQLVSEPPELPENLANKSVGELSFTEAGQVARSPHWYNLLIPFVGAAGVFLGGGLRRRSAES